MSNNKFLTPIFILTILLVLSSCAPKPMGFGVLLWWADREDLEEGAVYPVYEESNIRQTYLITPPDEAGIEVPRWRMDLFKSESAAREFSSAYTELIKFFGDAKVNGLAVRSTPSLSGERTYKLRQGQQVKLVEKIPGEETISGETGNWYRVLTADGSMGYAFGPNLDIYDAEVRAAQGDRLEVDPLLENFLSRNFRPEEFRFMLRENRVDLRRFSAAYGVFPDLESKTIRVVTDEDSFSFSFDKITMGEEGHFIFGESGLGVTIITPNTVVLHYPNKGEKVNEVYVALDGMAELIEAEELRRQELFESLRRMGSGTSNAYGTIAFEEPGQFTWEGYNRLTPSVIPDDVIGAGQVDIWYFPVPELARTYEGVFTFHFAGTVPGIQEEVNFLYQRIPQGLRLVHITDAQIKDELVQKLPTSPLVMFFTTPNPGYLTPPPEGE